MLRIAAITVAVIAVFMGVMYLRFSGDDDGRPVVVAATDIAACTEIKEGMVKVIEVPEDVVIAGAYADTQGVVGMVTRHAITEGDQMTASKGPSVPCHTGLPAGKRAVSLEIEPGTAEGGPVVVGDRIDIVIERDGAATTVVEDVEVLAVNVEVPAVGRTVSLTPSQQTITVDVEPQQTQLLVEALSNGGKIKLRKAGPPIVDFGPKLEE